MSMRYARPKECVKDDVDLYYCNYPFCNNRSKVQSVTAGNPAPIHCGRPMVKFNTISRLEWRRIRANSTRQVREIIARQAVDRIKGDRGLNDGGK